MFRAMLSHTWQGFVDSFRGFLVVPYLDKQSQTHPQTLQRNHSGRKKSTTKSKRNDEASVHKPTALELRRLQQGKSAIATNEPQNLLTDTSGKALKRIGYCIGVNLFCIISLYALQRLIGFLVSLREKGVQIQMENEESEGWILRNWVLGFLWVLSLMIKTFWLLPFFLVTRLVNCLWFQDIANAALRHLGKSATASDSFTRGVADFVLAIVLETLFLIQSFLVRFFIPVPYIAPLATYLHVTLLYSLYCFEYTWMSQGLDLSKRLDLIRKNWPYFFGFGLPLTLLTLPMPNFILSGGLFGVFFPFFIVSSFQAKPTYDRAKIPVFPVFAPALYVCNKLSIVVATYVRKKRF